MIELVCGADGKRFRVVQQEKADNPRRGVLFKVYYVESQEELGDFVVLHRDDLWEAFPDVDNRAHLKFVASAAKELMRELNEKRLFIE